MPRWTYWPLLWLVGWYLLPATWAAGPPDSARVAYRAAIDLGQTDPTAAIAALQALTARSDLSASMLGDIAYATGYYYNRLGQFYEAIPYFEAATRHLEPLPEAGAALNRARSALARGYTRLGEVDRAIDLYQLIADYGREAEAVGALLTAWIELGTAHGVLGQWKTALRYQEQALAHPEIPPLFAAIVAVNRSESLAQLGQVEAAQRSVRQGIAQLEALPEPAPGMLAEAYHALGDLLAEGEPEAAEGVYAQAIAHGVDVWGRPARPAGKLYLSLGHLAEQRGDWQAAIDAYQQALRYVLPGFEATDRLAQPVDSLLYPENVLFDALMGKGRAQLAAHAATGEARWLLAAEASFALAQQAALVQLAGLQAEQARLQWVGQTAQRTEAMLAVAHRLYQRTGDARYPRAAFEAAEQGRAILLREALVRASTRSPELVAQTAQVGRALLAYEEQLRAEGASASPGDTLTPLHRATIALRRRYDSLRQLSVRQYPSYGRANAAGEPDLAQVQARLAPDQALLSFSLGDTSLSVLLLRRDTLLWRHGPRPAALGQHIAQVRDMAQFAYQARGDTTLPAWAQAARALYRDLIAPLETWLPPRVVLVAAGELATVPFEALLRRPVSAAQPMRQWPFWLRTQEISYAPSAGIWLMQKAAPPAGRPRAAYALLAYAPAVAGLPAQEGAQRGPTWDPLVASRAEAEAVATAMGGELRLGPEATLSRFRAEAGQAQVLHLATHGQVLDARPRFSFLAFAAADTPRMAPLYLADLYTLRLQAELVVLSACETGLGKLYPGEGIASLARGFAYAGARSILTTLWRVSDQGSQRLMARFYHHLQAGQRKAAALRAAKLDLLADRPDYAHPYYWAGYVLQGDEEKLVSGGGSAWGWWLAGAALGLGLGAVALWWRASRRRVRS